MLNTSSADLDVHSQETTGTSPNGRTSEYISPVSSSEVNQVINMVVPNDNNSTSQDAGKISCNGQKNTVSKVVTHPTVPQDVTNSNDTTSQHWSESNGEVSQVVTTSTYEPALPSQPNSSNMIDEQTVTSHSIPLSETPSLTLNSHKINMASQDVTVSNLSASKGHNNNQPHC